MADATPSLITTPATLPDGKGNVLIKKHCPVCDVKYGYWQEEGDPGCMDCEISTSIANTVAAREKKAANEKAVFDAAVAAEVKKQIAAAMAEATAGSKDAAEYPQDEQEKKPEEKKPEEKKVSKRPFTKK